MSSPESSAPFLWQLRSIKTIKVWSFCYAMARSRRAIYSGEGNGGDFLGFPSVTSLAPGISIRTE